jgi:hypothetical protein
VPGLFGHLAHVSGVFGVILFCLLVVAYVALFGPRFRGLLLPALPLRPGGGVRRLLRISSYLARGFCAAYFVAAWAVGLAVFFGLVIGGNAYKRAFSGRSLIDHLMSVAGVVGAIVVFLFAVGYGWAAYFSYRSVRRWEQARVQRRRDRRAVRTLAAIENGAPAPYGAYSIWLRPFTSTGRCWVIARSTKAGTRNQPARLTGYRVVVADLETLLATIMEPIAPVIALGKSGEQVGAGRADVPDDRWQEAFALLARSAHAIFLLPSTRSGTHWELDFLVREPALLDRTVFLVPPDFFGNVSGIAGVEHDPGPHALASRRKITKRLDGDQETKSTYEQFGLMHAVNAEAIRDTLTAEAPEVRAEALRTLGGILPPEDYAAVAGVTGDTRFTRGGALLKLGGDRVVRVTALARLQVGYPGWKHFSDGPRFDQSLFRSGLLEMVQSAGRPPSAPG